jgi:hypothetical protein
MTEASTSPDQSSAGTSEAAESTVKRGPGRPKKVEQKEPAVAAAPLMVAQGGADEPVPSGVVNSKTRFFKVIWAAKSNPNDPNAIRLAVNGETITFKRSVECIVPEPYLDNARHAVYPKFTQEPGKGRKVVAYIERFPFTVLGPATFEEFSKSFREGTEKTRKAVEQYGIAIPVEDAVPQLR